MSKSIAATMTEAQLKVTKARNQMICTDPFFASLALKLVIVDDNTADTMWTDGVKIGYNQDFVNKITLDEVKGVMVHEVLHCANKHHLRRGQRDPQKWNHACDYAINYILKSAGYKLPDGGLDNPAYHNKSAEEIYNLLPDSDNGGGDNGNGKGNSKGKPIPGEVRDYDPHSKDETGKSPTESEKDEASTDWDIAINNAERAARAMGKHINEHIKRMIGDITDPRIPWKEVIARFVQEEVARNDYSWMRPNIRHMQRGFILPSMYSKTYGKVAVAIDTSGSVTHQQVADMIAEVIGILELYEDTVNEITLPVIYCDTAVRGVDNLALGDTPNPKGGGGTDFVPVFEYLHKLDEDTRPVALIYLTDGHCNSFPRQAPSIPVIWGLTERNRNFNPPFGDTLCMANE